MADVISSYKKYGVAVTYVVPDFNHFSKAYVKNNSHADNIIHVPAYKENISPQRILSHIIFSRGVKKILFSEKPEFIYCVIPPNTLVVSIASYKKKYPRTHVILDIFDTWPEAFPYKIGNPVMNLFFSKWKAIRDDNLYCADKVILVSDTTKKHIKTGATECLVIPPAMPADLIDGFDTNVESEIHFCYLGNINHITDIDTIVDFLAGIAKYKKTVLEIIGSGNNLGILKTRLEQANVGVICHGVIMDKEQKKNIFKRCAFGLNIPKEESAVTMSLKSIEYMRTGLPYINTAKGRNYEIVEKYGAGINLDKANLENSIQAIANVNNNNLKKIQRACKDAYIQQFCTGLLEQTIKETVWNTSKVM